MKQPYPNIPIEKDLRRKLTQDDKSEIVSLADEHSQRWLAKKFNVSRRTIQFTINPQRRLDNVERRKERIAKGERQETREARREYMRRFRKRQQEINGNAYYIYEKSLDPRRNKAKGVTL